MQSITLKELEWIHDCTVSTVVYDASNSSGRTIRLSMQCPDDLGYEPWEGKELVLVAIDVAVMKHVVWGWVTAPETVDAITPGVSDVLREGTRGQGYPGLEFSMCFHSGSELEIICRDLQIEVAS